MRAAVGACRSRYAKRAGSRKQGWRWSLSEPLADGGATTPVEYVVGPAVEEDALNDLFGASWPGHTPSDFAAVHRHSLDFVCAFEHGDLIGYVNLAWDGGVHAFLLDTTVHPRWRRRGVGRELVHRAVEVARAHGIQWLHVDYEPHLAGFYRACGFRPAEAGLIRLD